VERGKRGLGKNKTSDVLAIHCGSSINSFVRSAGVSGINLCNASISYLISFTLSGVANGCAGTASVVQVQGKKSVTVSSSVGGTVPFRPGCGGLFGIEG